MSSYDLGKQEAFTWIRQNFPEGSEILDVGACDGKWADMLNQYYTMDAVEAYQPNAERILGKYRTIYANDVCGLEYPEYDLIIFGDVIEHMTVEEAQQVIAYAKTRCTDMIVSVPWQYRQGMLYGNPFEIHRQDDLTMEIFNERYPGFEPIVEFNDYCYFHLVKS